MKYLKYFNNTSEYNTFVESEEYILPNLSLISTDVVYTSCLDPRLLNKAGTAIVYNTLVNQLMTIDGTQYNSNKWPQDKYIPVGVIVMPASHSSDGFARMMSTKFLGLKSTGSNTATHSSFDASNILEFEFNGMIPWASLDANESTNAVNSLIEYYENKGLDFPVCNKMPYANDGDPYTVGGISTESAPVMYTNLPNNFMNNLLQKTWTSHDGENGWNLSSGDIKGISPYNPDGTVNFNMRAPGTVMEFVHGDVPTKMINDYVDATASHNIFFAFDSVKTYQTQGTNRGDWYVPSVLECAYIAAKMKEIYATMNKLNPNFDETFDLLLNADNSSESNYLENWTSILHSNEYVWNANTPYGYNIGNTGAYGLFLFALAPVRN